MSFLLERFRDNADKIAIIDDGKSYTYGELLEGILDLSSTTLKGIKNKVVAIIGGYSFYNIALFLALYENKNIIVPLVECNETALKESTADINRIIELIHICDNKIAVYSGEDNLNYLFYALGGEGAVSVTANILPHEVVNLYELVKD